MELMGEVPLKELGEAELEILYVSMLYVRHATRFNRELFLV